MSTVKVSITLACKNYFSYRAISGELNNDIEWGRVGEGWWCCCGSKYDNVSVKFCTKCGSRLELPTSSNSSVFEKETTAATLSLAAFKARKEASRSNFFKPSAKRPKGPEKDVTIRIGIFQLDCVTGVLKPQWGKTLPLSVDRNSNYSTVLERALTKRKVHDRHFDKRCKDEEFELLYPDGSQALFLPGEGRKFF